jgi:PhnB protein
VSLVLYVDDVDALAKRAVGAGAKEIRPVQDQFYGDRSGTFADPFGHVWTISTHKEDISMEEMKKRMPAECAPDAKGAKTEAKVPAKKGAK